MELRFSDLDRLRKCLFLASQSQAAISTEGSSTIEKLECYEDTLYGNQLKKLAQFNLQLRNLNVRLKCFFHHKTLAKLDVHGGCIAQWLHLHLSPCCPGFDSRDSLMYCTARINKWTVQKFNNVDWTHLVHIHSATKKVGVPTKMLESSKRQFGANFATWGQEGTKNFIKTSAQFF